MKPLDLGLKPLLWLLLFVVISYSEAFLLLKAQVKKEEKNSQSIEKKKQ